MFYYFFLFRHLLQSGFLLFVAHRQGQLGVYPGENSTFSYFHFFLKVFVGFLHMMLHFFGVQIQGLI